MSKKAYLEPPTELFVEKEAGELSSARPLQELDKDLAERTLNLVGSFLELLVPHEVGLVVVRLELLKQGLELGIVEVLVDLRVEQPLHLVEVRRVEPGCQQGLLDPLLVALLRRLAAGGRRLRGGGARHSHAEGWQFPGATQPRSGGGAKLGNGFYQRHFCCHFLIV